MIQAVWVHGTSVKEEREGYFINKTRVGWGTIFTTTGSQWFHFSIPTPVISNDKSSNLQKVFVLYSTTLSAVIQEIHLYDGFQKIKEFLGLNFKGNHSNTLDAQNSFNIPPTHIKFGLGISILVNFGDSSINGVPQITFNSTGADFSI